MSIASIIQLVHPFIYQSFTGKPIKTNRLKHRSMDLEKYQITLGIKLKQRIKQKPHLERRGSVNLKTNFKMKLYSNYPFLALRAILIFTSSLIALSPIFFNNAAGETDTEL